MADDAVKDEKFHPLTVVFFKKTYSILQQVADKRMRKRTVILREILNEWAFQGKWKDFPSEMAASKLMDKPTSIGGIDKEIIKMIDLERAIRGRSRSDIVNMIVTAWAEDIKDEIDKITPD